MLQDVKISLFIFITIFIIIMLTYCVFFLLNIIFDYKNERKRKLKYVKEIEDNVSQMFGEISSEEIATIETIKYQINLVEKSNDKNLLFDYFKMRKDIFDLISKNVVNANPNIFKFQTFFDYTNNQLIRHKNWIYKYNNLSKSIVTYSDSNLNIYTFKDVKVTSHESSDVSRYIFKQISTDYFEDYSYAISIKHYDLLKKILQTIIEEYIELTYKNKLNKIELLKEKYGV